MPALAAAARADGASLACSLLASHCAARSLTGQGPGPVHRRGWGTSELQRVHTCQCASVRGAHVCATAKTPQARGARGETESARWAVGGLRLEAGTEWAAVRPWVASTWTLGARPAPGPAC